MTSRRRPRYLAARSRRGDGWVVDDQATDEIVARFPFGNDPHEATRIASQLAYEFNQTEESR
jgi:hypothetical protein